MRAPCKIEGCERESRGRGWCGTHWRRWREHGDPTVVKRNGVDYCVKPQCNQEGCDRTAQALGLCSMHYSRYRKHGDASIVGPRNGRPLIGEYPTFAAIHKRLFREMGPAANYECVDCGGKAAEWSYNQSDPNEVIGRARNSKVAYSLDISNYDPRCIRCHRIFDKAGENRVRNEKGQFAADRQPGVNVKVKALA